MTDLDDIVLDVDMVKRLQQTLVTVDRVEEALRDGELDDAQAAAGRLVERTDELVAMAEEGEDA